MTSREAAIAAILAETGGTGQISRLWGPAFAPARARILTALRGAPKPIAKSSARYRDFERELLAEFVPDLSDDSGLRLCSAVALRKLEEAVTGRGKSS